MGRRFVIGLAMAVAHLSAQSLAERLGHPAGAKLLLLNADDAGLSHGVNEATLRGLRQGVLGSATLMVPAPWFPEMAAEARRDPGLDLGIHLVFTSEWEPVRWGPVLGRSAVPTLVDGTGAFHPGVPAFLAAAEPAEAEREGAAQVEKALAAGVDVTHLDLHMHALALDPRFFDVYVRLARRFDLPVRFLPSSERLAEAQRRQLAEAGILAPDHLILGGDVLRGESLETYWLRRLQGLGPGVTEAYVHLAEDSPDLRALTGDEPFRTGWRDRVEEARLFTQGDRWRQVFAKAGIRLIRWRDLRDAQRRARRKD